MARSSHSSSSSSSAGSKSSLNPLRALAMLAGAKPIELLVTGFCIVTLVYFQLLHAVKHSEFLSPSSLSSGSLFGKPDTSNGRSIFQDSSAAASTSNSALVDSQYTTLARNEHGQWLEVPSNAPQLANPELETLLVSRIIVGLDSHMRLAEDDSNILVYPAHSSAPALFNDDSQHIHRPSAAHRAQADSNGKFTNAATNPPSLQDQQIQASLKQFEQHIKVADYAGHSFQEVCYRPSSSNSNTDEECLSVSFPSNEEVGSASATVLSLGLDSSHPEAYAFQAALASSSPLTDSKGYTYVPVAASASATGRKSGQDGLGLSFSAFPSTNGLSSTNAHYNAEDQKSVKWMFYAGRALIMRFYGLAKVSFEHCGYFLESEVCPNSTLTRHTVRSNRRKPTRRISSLCCSVTF